MNITETCDDTDEQKDKPNLIVNVQVKEASAADNGYLKDVVSNIQENSCLEEIVHSGFSRHKN